MMESADHPSKVISLLIKTDHLSEGAEKRTKVRADGRHRGISYLPHTSPGKVDKC